MESLTKRMVITSGCALNQHLRATGCHVDTSTIRMVLEWILANHLSIHPLCCPEKLYFESLGKTGLGRPPHGRKWYEDNGLRPIAKDLAEKEAKTIRDYANHGIQIIGVVGVERSPACSTRQDNPSVYYPSGIFMEELRTALTNENIEIPFVSITGSRTQTQFNKLKGLINE